jgi:hypothetical protein
MQLVTQANQRVRTQRKNQRIDMKICLLKFGITTHDPYISVEVA